MSERVLERENHRHGLSLMAALPRARRLGVTTQREELS